VVQIGDKHIYDILIHMYLNIFYVVPVWMGLCIMSHVTLCFYALNCSAGSVFITCVVCGLYLYLGAAEPKQSCLASLSLGEWPGMLHF
jgi:hypothetical protein